MSSSNTSNLFEVGLPPSWDVNNDRETGRRKLLRETFTINTSKKSVTLEEVVQLDTCVHLHCRTEVAEPCTISITVADTAAELVSHLVVISEARVIELYGKAGEYLVTCPAEYVDDFEDLAVYRAECTLRPSKVLTIKFQNLKHVGSMWVYGINLTLIKGKNASPGFTSSINFQRVNDMLKECKIPISENAEKCKAFLQGYSGEAMSSDRSGDHERSEVHDNSTQTSIKRKPPNTQMLIKMLDAGYFSPLGETGRNMSRRISSFLTREGSADYRNVPKLSMERNSSEEDVSSDMLILKSYIDQRFTQLECKIDRFKAKIKEMDRRQNEKLDCILTLLHSLNG